MSMAYTEGQSIPVPVNAFDNRGFWEGVNRHELVFQKCQGCGSWVHPPRPMCPRCHSVEKEWAASTGKGKVYSYVIYRESPHPAFRAPYAVVLVEMDEGVRLVSNMVDIEADEIHIGMPVEVVFEDVAEGVTLPKFRKLS